MQRYNVAQALEEVAARAPFRPAVVFPAGRERGRRGRPGRAKFVQLNFQQLNQECDRYAHGLSEYGIRQGERTLMMVRPGVELIAIAFALLKVGAVPVLIDPGMGRKAFLQCVGEAEPTAFIGIPLAHALRTLYPKPFRTIEHAVTVGPGSQLGSRLWGGATLDQVCSDRRDPFPVAPTGAEDEGAVAFTSGSTGLPKGVIYLHGMFQAQIELLYDEVGYVDAEVDLPGLYIFALFNPALGATTIFPDMDPTRPAEVNPAYLVEAIQTHGVTTSFGSPTIWKRVAAYCLANDIRLPSLKRILMAGAPVPPTLIEQFTHILDVGDVYTPFGATEALPITMIGGREILDETAALSESGKGMCVGRAVKGHTIRIIRISDDPIPEWDESLVLGPYEVGEIVVKGPVVTRTYLHRPQETAKAKIAEPDLGDGTGPSIWHRMGDLGYLDEVGRLWFCGRKSHRVETEWGLMLPVPCEAIYNRHPDVYRTALVGVGERGRQRPVLVVEPRAGKTPRTEAARGQLIRELLALGAQHEQTRPIRDVLFHPSFPVDVRHNAKILRRKLATWAADRIKPQEASPSAPGSYPPKGQRA
jgi:acyl-CoA synthetase (AMP-forming)/AMP-acid ligase II